MGRPVMIVVAGPPGSGKTTCFPVSAFGVDFFNIDDRCAQILGSYRSISRDVRRAVAAECEQVVGNHIENRRSFAVETTLRTSTAIKQAQRARQAGFSTHLRFIATESVEQNVFRILGRAQAGGHAASERDIRAIYEASLGNLRDAIEVFERVRVYDSTALWISPRLVATAYRGKVDQQGTVPKWIERILVALPELEGK